MFRRFIIRFPRRVMLTAVYVYCILLIHRFSDSWENDRLNLESAKRELQERGQMIKAECFAHPPPMTKSQKQAHEAASVNKGISDHYTNQHLKQAVKDVIYMPKNNMTWCIVPKVASTSWSKALLELEGVTEDDLLHSDKPLQVLLRQSYKPVPIDKINSTLATSTKYLFARHPFQRVVSAYRNKLEDSYKEEDGSYFYNIYGRSIVEKYRVFDKNEHQKWVVDPNEVKTSEMDGEFRREPTFMEFVDYLIDTDINSYDEHWKPITLQCHVCDFGYDYIVKYENFQEEIGLLINILKEKKSLPSSFVLQWKNKGGTDEDVAKQYLKQISYDKLWKLFDKYRHDFGYFGYTMKNYIDLSL